MLGGGGGAFVKMGRGLERGVGRVFCRGRSAHGIRCVDLNKRKTFVDSDLVWLNSEALSPSLRGRAFYEIWGGSNFATKKPFLPRLWAFREVTLPRDVIMPLGRVREVKEGECVFGLVGVLVGAIVVGEKMGLVLGTKSCGDSVVKVTGNVPNGQVVGDLVGKAVTLISVCREPNEGGCWAVMRAAACFVCGGLKKGRMRRL